MHSKILAIDASSREFSVALCDATKVAAQHSASPATASSAALVPAIQDLFRSAGWELDNIDAIAATSGPGSFSGLRVAATVAKSIAYLLNKPIFGISTMEVISWRARTCDLVSKEPDLVVIIDAQRNEFFVQEFDCLNSLGPVPKSEIEIVSQNKLRNRIGRSIVTGPGLSRAFQLGSLAAPVARHGEFPSEAQSDDFATENSRYPDFPVRYLPPQYWNSTAVALSELIIGRYANLPGEEWSKFGLNYGRPCAAEEKHLERRK